MEKKKKKEVYEKPKIISEKIAITVYGQASPVGPIQQMQPFFGLCPPCNA